MKRKSISKHLKRFRMPSRRSTWDGAFASALMGYDEYDDAAVCGALRDLGQDPDGELWCVYCDQPAATWDHVFRRVVKRQPSGYGHHVRNLVPCCRSCNERKSAKPWQEWLAIKAMPDQMKRAETINRFLAGSMDIKRTVEDIHKVAPAELARFREIQSQVHTLIKEADQLAQVIHQRCQAPRQ